MDKDISYSGMLVKALKVLYVVLGFLPAVWLLSFVAVIGAATFRLGNIPHYMQSPSPASLGLEAYAYMTAMTGAMALISMFVWPVLSAIVFFSPLRNAVLTSRPLILFSAGTAGYLLLEWQASNVLTWITQ
jgi:hypothetical protein